MQRVINKSTVSVIEDKMIITTEYTDTLTVEDILQAIKKNREAQDKINKQIRLLQEELSTLINEEKQLDDGVQQILYKE